MRGAALPYGEVVASVEAPGNWSVGTTPVAVLAEATSVCVCVGICGIDSVTVSTPPISPMEKFGPP
jgi:hypothetical protein